MKAIPYTRYGSPDVLQPGVVEESASEDDGAFAMKVVMTMDDVGDQVENETTHLKGAKAHW